MRKLAILSLLLASCMSCYAESATIRIRFVNGKSGKPLHLKSYENGPEGYGAVHYKVERVQGHSLIVSFQDVSTFSFRSRYFEPCDTKGPSDPQPLYNLSDVKQQGVAPNDCGQHTSPATPGVLVIYSCHEHWWRMTGRVAKGLLICG